MNSSRLDTLPPEIILDIISLLHVIDYFPLKLAGSHYILSIVRSVYCRSRTEYEERLGEVNCSLLWRNKLYYHALRTTVSRGQTTYIWALLQEYESYKSKPTSWKGSMFGARFSKFNRPQESPKSIERCLEITEQLSYCLAWAARCGLEDIIQLLIHEKAVDINGNGFDGKSSLWEAIDNEQKGAARLLLNKGADVVFPDSYTILHAAADRSDDDMTRFLIDEYINRVLHVLAEEPRHWYRSRASIIDTAAYNHNFGSVKLLLDLGFRSDFRCFSCYGCYTLECAAKNSGRSEAKTVLELLRGQPPTYKGTQEAHLQPLHAAVLDNDLEKFQCLLNNKEVDVNARDQDGDTAFEKAICTNRLPLLKLHESIEYLFGNESSKIEGDTLLHFGVQSGCDPSIIRYLLARGSDMNTRNTSHQLTPLHYAAAIHSVKNIKILVEAGVDIDAKASNGQTPLAMLLSTVCPPIAVVEAFLSHGADVNAQDNYGYTALHLATARLDISYTLALLQYGAEVNTRDKDGCTPLHLLVRPYRRSNDADISKDFLQTLLNHGADVNARDNVNRTPSHYAYRVYPPSFAEMLNDAGADPNALDLKGYQASKMRKFGLCYGKKLPLWERCKNGWVLEYASIDVNGDDNGRIDKGETSTSHIPDGFLKIRPFYS